MKRFTIIYFMLATILYPSEKIMVLQNNISINYHGEYFDVGLPHQLNTQISRDIDYIFGISERPARRTYLNNYQVPPSGFFLCKGNGRFNYMYKSHH